MFSFRNGTIPDYYHLGETFSLLYRKAFFLEIKKLECLFITDLANKLSAKYQE